MTPRDFSPRHLALFLVSSENSGFIRPCSVSTVVRSHHVHSSQPQTGEVVSSAHFPDEEHWGTGRMGVSGRAGLRAMPVSRGDPGRLPGGTVSLRSPWFCLGGKVSGTMRPLREQCAASIIPMTPEPVSFAFIKTKQNKTTPRSWCFLLPTSHVCLFQNAAHFPLIHLTLLLSYGSPEAAGSERRIHALCCHRLLRV